MTDPSRPQRSTALVEDLARKFGVDASAFEALARAHCFAGHDPRYIRPEDLTHVLLLAREHNLNPLTRELFVLRSPQGTIIPVVSIDGWIRKMNEHPAFDGIDFVEHTDDRGQLRAITCQIWRKDRSRPITVTEYLAECARPTDAWRMKHRMLRHKAAVQCARYAFGFAGLVDPDEAERILEASDAAAAPVAVATGPEVTALSAPAIPPAPNRASHAPRAAMRTEQQDLQQGSVPSAMAGDNRAPIAARPVPPRVGPIGQAGQGAANRRSPRGHGPGARHALSGSSHERPTPPRVEARPPSVVGPSMRRPAPAVDATPKPTPQPHAARSPGHGSDPDDRPGPVAVATVPTVPTLPLAATVPATPAVSIVSDTPSEDELRAIDARLSKVEGVELLVEVWESEIVPRMDRWLPPFVSDALTIYRRHQRRLAP